MYPQKLCVCVSEDDEGEGQMTRGAGEEGQSGSLRSLGLRSARADPKRPAAGGSFFSPGGPGAALRPSPAPSQIILTQPHLTSPLPLTTGCRILGDFGIRCWPYTATCYCSTVCHSVLLSSSVVIPPHSLSQIIHSISHN